MFTDALVFWVSCRWLCLLLWFEFPSFSPSLSTARGPGSILLCSKCTPVRFIKAFSKPCAYFCILGFLLLQRSPPRWWSSGSHTHGCSPGICWTVLAPTGDEWWLPTVWSCPHSSWWIIYKAILPHAIIIRLASQHITWNFHAKLPLLF